MKPTRPNREARVTRLRKRLRNLPTRQPLSLMLLHFARHAVVPTNIGKLRDSLAGRGHAAFLFLIGAFSMLPLPPGGSIVFGIPALIITGQLILQRPTVWLPKRVLDWQLSDKHLDLLRKKIVPRLFWLEKFVKPRYWPLPVGRDGIFVGTCCAILTMTFMVPIPFGNFPSALAITLLALALLQRDGILLLIGLIVSALWMAAFTIVFLSAVVLANGVTAG